MNTRLRFAGVIACLVLVGVPALTAQQVKDAGQKERININTATAEELQVLKGIGAVLAQSIVRHREVVGRFRKVEELMAIQGISRKMIESFRERIEVGTSDPTGSPD